MAETFEKFERIVRLSYKYPDARPKSGDGSHPFDQRNIHPEIQQVSKDLFDDGHFPQATFAAFKCIEKKVQEVSTLPSSLTGFDLMMKAFNGDTPKIRLNHLVLTSGIEEQEGYKFIFGGSMRGIRNPRAHGSDISDTPDQCLDYLSLASLLLKRIDRSNEEENC